MSDEPFRTAIEAAGYKPLRIDQKEHINRIPDETVAEIRRSKFVAADFTGSRGGVYFEAGFATGLGIPVIWTCRRDWVEKLHFDTSQFTHIVWENDEDLRARLLNRIRAVIV